MSIGTLLAAFDAQARGEPAVPPPGVSYETDGPLLRVVGQHRGFISAPPDVGARGPGLDALIARQRDCFAARGEAVEWKTFAHDQPPDLTSRLRAAGFVPEPAETVMIGLAAELTAGPVLPAGVSLRPVTSATDLLRISGLQSRVSGADCGWLATELADRIAATPDEVTVLAAEADGEIISSGRIEFVPGTGFAGLWGGATLPQWRSKGIYRALVARRAQLATAREVRYLQVDASPNSAPILARLGFRAVTTTTPYVWTPPAARP